MKPKHLYWLAIILIVETGLLHMMMAQAEYDEAAYMGYLFAANFLGALIAAFGIYHRQFWGWVIGLLVAAGSIFGYAWSRTFGMPGMNVEEWFTPYGVISVSIESLFIIIFLMRPWKNFILHEPLSFGPGYMRFPPQVLALIVVAGIGTLTYKWDVTVTQAYGHHIGSLAQVCKIPVTSLTDLEARYGVQVSLIADSMMGSIVDVRLKIVDPDKAHVLLNNQAALLLNQEALIVAPHMHSHGLTRLKVGKEFIIFFPTQQKIHRGSEVSLVFGSIRIEPVAVK